MDGAKRPIQTHATLNCGDYCYVMIIVKLLILGSKTTIYQLIRTLGSIKLVFFHCGTD